MYFGGKVWWPKGGRVDVGGMGRECDIQNYQKKVFCLGKRRFIFIYLSMWGRVTNATGTWVPSGIRRELQSQAVVMSH